jgi:uncharacterized SAM-binding protein YcdF (DUF218 family)
MDVETKRRVEYAASRWHRHRYDVIVLSGGVFREGQKGSAALMAAIHLSTLGVDTPAILLEEHSVDTFTNAEFSLDLLRKRYGKSPMVIDVVSNIPHTLRAYVIFRRHLGVKVRMRPMPDFGPLHRIPQEIANTLLHLTFDPHGDNRALVEVRNARRRAGSRRTSERIAG